METRITVREDLSAEESGGERFEREEIETERDMHHCTECGWSIDRNDRATEHERNQRTIEHHIETGHTIVSRAPPTPPSGSADESESRHQAAE